MRGVARQTCSSMTTVPAAFHVWRTFSAGKAMGLQSSGTWRAQLSCARIPQTSQHDPRCMIAVVSGSFRDSLAADHCAHIA